MIIDRGHFAEVGAIEVILQLQVIWGISEYQIHRVLGERIENLDAIALQDLVEGDFYFSQLCSISLACLMKYSFTVCHEIVSIRYGSLSFSAFSK